MQFYWLKNHLLFPGFAENNGKCTLQASKELTKSGLTLSSSRHELGTAEIHVELEKTISEFLGVEDAITVGMGFATNTLNLPMLMGKGIL